MNNIHELHAKAMELVDQAFLKCREGDAVSAKKLFQESFSLEKAAAMSAREENIGEPSESVLLRSAASIALNADMYHDAEKLACLALSGDPPEEIADELRDILEQSSFNRHLALNGIQLAKDEMQVVLVGAGISSGMVQAHEFLGRVSILQTLVYRTAERIRSRKFRPKGPIGNEFKKLTPYLSVPQAGSFAFTVRLGGGSQQTEFDGFGGPNGIMDDIIKNLTYVNEGNYKKLKKSIDDPAYYRNFVALTKELAPDGKDISLVGLTVIRNNKPKQVQFQVTKNNIKLPVPRKYHQKKREIVEGRLFEANDEKLAIQIEENNGKKTKIIVPKGLGDIVKEYWGEQVRVKAIRTHDKKLDQEIIQLMAIDLIPEQESL